MKIYIAKFEPDRNGGGWSFQRNLSKALKDNISEYSEADIYFITSPSMVQRDEVEQAKKDGKKIVLRIDNAVRNSRNRNTGMSRMYDFAQIADLIVYQSHWAKDYLKPFLCKDGIVIHNSADESIFNTDNRNSDGHTHLYSRFNRDETKGFEIARYYYSQTQLRDKHARLLIVGQYSQELIDGQFDFYMNEDYQYLGVVNDPQYMASLYKKSDYLVYTYFNDACSNTLIEAKLCGLRVLSEELFMKGSADEIVQLPNEYFFLDRMGNEYLTAMEKL